MPDRRTVLLAMGATLGLGEAMARAGAEASDAYDEPDAMYAALFRQPHITLPMVGGTIDVTFADGASGIDRRLVVDWIRLAGRAMIAYFGRYPVDRYRLLVIAEPGETVGHATTFGYAGPATRIRVGTHADATAFANDWVLVHEMVHTALPDLPRRALWLQEGNATYVEPVARAQAGQLTEEDVWRQAVAGMPGGEPRPGDGGMDGTRAHNRLYWGGATFWLRAEVEIALRTSGRKMLRDAMRGMNRASGGNAATWTPEQLMAAGDAATGVDILAGLYEAFAHRRVGTDLPTLFSRLGVIARPDGSVRLDDRAELAWLRRRICIPS
ncbi:hypothetical protein [Sphingomonas oryzagri]|uniref:Peptidase M61 catalytic domain-containing protein n=1 Tax=Sphingomonas oryzagri TaxID=3042314 RepID=A0ABT6N5S0_9SPHN|nr:hypothetical protein [Sphingomonas oryzagri]MDH7640447.1 hypothetical protein [Sphingomonas oryzagri]